MYTHTDIHKYAHTHTHTHTHHLLHPPPISQCHILLHRASCHHLSSTQLSHRLCSRLGRGALRIWWKSSKVSCILIFQKFSKVSHIVIFPADFVSGRLLRISAPQARVSVEFLRFFLVITSLGPHQHFSKNTAHWRLNTMPLGSLGQFNENI